MCHITEDMKWAIFGLLVGYQVSGPVAASTFSQSGILSVSASEFNAYVTIFRTVNYHFLLHFHLPWPAASLCQFCQCPMACHCETGSQQDCRPGCPWPAEWHAVTHHWQTLREMLWWSLIKKFIHYLHNDLRAQDLPVRFILCAMTPAYCSVITDIWTAFFGHWCSFIKMR